MLPAKKGKITLTSSVRQRLARETLLTARNSSGVNLPASKMNVVESSLRQSPFTTWRGVRCGNLNGVNRVRGGVPLSTLPDVAELGVAVGGHNFMLDMLEALDNIAGTRSGTIEQLEYVPIALPSSRSGSSIQGGTFRLIEPPRLETQ